MKEVPLTRGMVARVDDDDYARVAIHKYHADESRHTFYAARAERVNGKYRKIYMHREITGAPDGMEVDHWDWDGLNNTRANLRVCTHTENLRHRRIPGQARPSLSSGPHRISRNGDERSGWLVDTGWRIERTHRGRYYQWRKGSGKNRQSCPGGKWGRLDPIVGMIEGAEAEALIAEAFAIVNAAPGT